MSWGQPGWLDWLWATPLVAGLLWMALRRRATLLARLGPLVPERVSRRAVSVHRWRALLWFAGMVLGLVALAQPRWGFRWQELKREGLDIVVVLDVSSSMDAEDVSPTRMERARREVLDLTELLAGDRVGLVVFAGGAYPRMPLTLDYGVLQHQVRDSHSGTLVAQGSDIGAAMEMAMGLLGPRGAADQVILLISDGEDHVGEALTVAEKAAAEGVHIYTMGVGTPEGAPVPLTGGGFKKTRGGEVVISKLDESLMQDIARVGQGAYVRSAASNRDISAIYLEEIRGRLQGAEQGVRRERIWDERFAWPLSAAIGLILLASLLRPGSLRLPGAMMALWFFALSGRPVLAAGADEAAAAEVERLTSAQAARPDDLDIAEELGMALLQSGRANEAHDVLTSVAERTLDPTQRTRARFNAGHAAQQSGHLTKAVEDWQRVVQEDPDHAGAQTNAQVVQQEIARRLNQQQSQQDGQQQDGQQQDGQQQDGQQQDGQHQDGPQQDGPQQDGPQQDGPQQDGPQQDGQQQDGQQQDGQQQDGQQQGGDAELDGTRDATAGGADTGAPGSLDGLQAAGTEEAEAGADGEADARASRSTGAATGEMTPEEAARTVDSVEEGRPQVVARPGSAGDKDW